MASPYNITISSGTGEEGILNGSYKVSAGCCWNEFL